jgi:hypothetical protein
MDCHPSSNGARGVYFSDPQSQGIADPRLSKMHADEKKEPHAIAHVCVLRKKRSYEKRRQNKKPNYGDHSSPGKFTLAHATAA